MYLLFAEMWRNILETLVGSDLVKCINADVEKGFRFHIVELHQ